MTTAYTSLLGLALPVTGELSGTWGDTVNNSITSLLDSAIAGTTTISADADVTLSTTTGAANTAREAILLWTANGTVTRNITAPAQSKIYTVINASAGTQSIVLRGAGPTTGVTILKGESALCAWNGSDFIKISNTAGAGAFTSLTVSGTTALNGNTTIGDAAADSLTVNATIGSNLIFTDNTYDIGASGATRPRNLYLGGLLTMGGALTVNGNVTLGDAAADTVTVNGTVASNLIFTDNTYDIGASGATRPRTLYLGTSLITPAITNSGLTTGRVVYTTTGGLETSSANLLYSGTDLTVYGLTVGRGAGAVLNNAAFGSSALAANTTGTGNTAIGRAALTSNTTSNYNTAVGFNTMFSVIGSNNTAVGSEAMTNTGSATDNAAFGYNALYTNISGNYNTAVGSQALKANTASQSTAVGYNALFASTAAYNTAVGAYAGAATTSGDSNTFIGQGSGATNTTGGSNTTLGRNSLNANTTGGSNTALGYLALGSNTTANNNTAVGWQAATANTTGTALSAFGVEALLANTTGVANAAFGGVYSGVTGASLRYNTTGSYNTAIGIGALSANTTGSLNSALGYQAGYSQSTGGSTPQYNTWIGAQAGYSNTTASNNVAVGYAAGYTNTTGGNCVYVGPNAGYTRNAAGNTCIGFNSGYFGTSGTYNTFVGYNSGSSITSGYSNVILGSFSGNYGLDIRTAGNNIVLSDGDGNSRALCDSIGNWTYGDTGSVLASKTTVRQTTQYPVSALMGPGGSQGTPTWITVVKQLPVVSLGNKINIPFVNQGSINNSTIVRVRGVSAKYNDNNPLAFVCEFACGHLGVVYNLSSWSLATGVTSVTSSGLTVTINLSSTYTSTTSNGVFVVIEYLTSFPTLSIDVANIAMN